MTGHTMKLLTIICEALAREAIVALVHHAGAHGYTITAVEGSGEKGIRTAEMTELANIKIDVIVPDELAGKILERLQKEFFPSFAMIAYVSDVQVVRSEKF